MTTPPDFAQQVWLSLENIRERLAVVETEVRHSRCHLHRLESDLHGHVAYWKTGSPAGNNGDAEEDDSAITLRISRKVLGGGSILGAGLGLAIGLGKALGWW